MSSVRSANFRSPPGPSHANPSPRAAGAPFHVGLGSPGQSALPPPQRIAGSYASFQPPGGLARGLTSGVPRHHGTAVPPALPHDRRVRNVGPGQAHPVAKAGNSPLCVARGVAGKPCLFLSGRTVYFCYSSQGVYERGSILVTTNPPLDEWAEVFGLERLTGALLDRLTRYVHILEMNVKSYRLKRSRENAASQAPEKPEDA